MPIDVQRARAQHAEYEAALKHLGLSVLSLPEEPTLADSVFVEDTALVLDECAIILRPGADSRRPETESIAKALAPYRKLFTIETPARVDGGDILRVGKQIYVGLSSRSDTNAMEQMQDFLQPYGYKVYAANALMIGDTILYPKAFPKTHKELEDAGINILDVNADELAKAEGALT